MTQYTVLLVRSQNLAWDSVRRALEALSDVEIVGDVETAPEAVTLAHELAPDVIFISSDFVGLRSPEEEAVYWANDVLGTLTTTEMASELGLPALIIGLKRLSLLSRIVVFIDDQLERIPRDEFLTLYYLPVKGVLQWKDAQDVNRFRKLLLLVTAHLHPGMASSTLPATEEIIAEDGYGRRLNWLADDER